MVVWAQRLLSLPLLLFCFYASLFISVCLPRHCSATLPSLHSVAAIAALFDQRRSYNFVFALLTTNGFRRQRPQLLQGIVVRLHLAAHVRCESCLAQHLHTTTTDGRHSLRPQLLQGMLFNSTSQPFSGISPYRLLGATICIYVLPVLACTLPSLPSAAIRFISSLFALFCHAFRLHVSILQWKTTVTYRPRIQSHLWT